MLVRIARQLRAATEPALNLLFPPHCSVCRTETPAGEHLCPGCRKGAPVIAAPFCQICSEPFEGRIDNTFSCPNCRERNFHFGCAVASYRFQGVVRDLILRFKYQGKLHLRHVLAGWLADNLADARLQHPFDRIVPVPLHPTRERERGFNQARILAELLARQTGAPVCHDLKRIRYTTTQTRFDRETRIENLRNAFRLRPSGDVRNLHLLLIDDVFTTGSTVDECARVLMEAGAASVRVVAVARG